MQKAAKKIVPHALDEDSKGWWGLSRIMSYDKFIFAKDMYRIPGRQKPFVSEANGSGTQVYFLGGLIDETATEFHWMGKSRVSVIAQLTPNLTADARATGVASVIAGESFSISSQAEIKNIAGVNSKNLNEALKLCLADEYSQPSLIYISFTPEAADWITCGDTLKALEAKGVPVILPAGTEKLKHAINVAPTDINDQAPPTTWKSSDIFAPGVEVTCSSLGSHIQVLSGADVAAAFVAGIGVNHLKTIQTQNLNETLLECFLRTCPRTNKSLGIAMLWNPYQVFEPAWDMSQDAFLGSFTWDQNVDITLQCLNIDRNDLQFEVVHSDLPATVKIENGVVKGKATDPKDGSTHCYHFVIKAKFGESESSKMFYITFTDSPFKIDFDKYRNLNESAKGVHYSGSPSPPAMPPYHFSCSCLDGSTKILMADGSEKNISDITAGDKIKNRKGGVSEVLHVMEVIAAERNLFSVNNGALLLTADHRVHTAEGTAAINYKNEIHADGTPLMPLQTGSTLLAADGQTVKVHSLTPAQPTGRSLYNLVTDNDSGYITNGLCCETEVFTSILLTRAPQVKGAIYAGLMKG